MKNGLNLVSGALVLGLLPLLGGGCSTPAMGRYEVRVKMAESMADSTRMLPSVEIHLLALDPVTGRQFQGYSMSDYWNPNRKRDDFTKRVMHFGQGKENPQVLSIRDPIWDRWDSNGAEHLFVMADLQGLYEDKEDVKDPRRLILPLAPDRWDTKVIQIMIEKGGVYCVTPRLMPEGKK